MIKRGNKFQDGKKVGYYKSDLNNKMFLYEINNKDSMIQAKLLAEKHEIKKNESTIETNSCNFKIIEICEDEESDIIGRKKITLAFHEIHNDNTKYNHNGLSFDEKYVEEAMNTAINMPLCVSYVDDDRDMISGHGTKVIDIETGETYFENSEILGTITDVFITEIEVEGKTVKVLAGSGYIYTQRHHNLMKYLDDIKDTETISGSIEIAVTEYVDGWKPKGRVPKLYCYTGHALVIDPADKNAIVMELNENEGEEMKNNVLVKKYSVELNEKSFDDIGYLVCTAFNDAMKPDDYCNSWYYDEYYIHKIYSTYVIMKKYGEYGKYWRADYKVNGYKVTLENITLAEMEWIPVEGDSEIKVEVSSLKDVKNDNGSKSNVIDETFACKKKNENNESEENAMTVEELNSTIVDKDNKIEELQKTLETNSKVIEEKETKLNELETELNTIKGLLKALEDEKLVSELNSVVEKYTDETRDFYKEKIETFAKEPTEEVKKSLTEEMNKFDNTITELKKTNITEVNNKQKAEDIYSEINELDDESKDDIYDIY